MLEPRGFQGKFSRCRANPKTLLGLGESAAQDLPESEDQGPKARQIPTDLKSKSPRVQDSKIAWQCPAVQFI